MGQPSRRRPEPKPSWHPRWWPTLALLALMRLLARLPFAVQRELGHGIGAIASLVAGRRRRIAARNLALCFPELSSDARRTLLRQHFRAAGISTLETAVAWFRSPQDYAHRLDIQGLEHLRAAQAEGNGVILAGCHFVTLEICGALLSTVADVDVMYRPNRNPVFERVQREGRERRYGAVIARGDIRTAARRLREGRAIWYAADQDYGLRHSVFVPFFGIPAATLTATARLARMTGARVLLVDHWRDDARMRWTIRFSPALDGYPSGDEERDAARLSDAVEDAVRAHPAQYLWMHRRFKTRPPGGADLYR
ncbi:MAG TPA: LpxL/LpxP family Kdo(2)-lipid IV(A) lauroyl/palmitoleoyl acyltransferase [Pseudomonadales bacterium]|nr:LpxL/LpxP family Kdo(2)-lipid IV(A) lauroyl/palmitoleoyl acyltransferase [Pseudomonadales bacterium]